MIVTLLVRIVCIQAVRKADLIAKHSTTTISSTPPTKSAPPKPKPTSAPPASSKKSSSSAAKAGTKRKKTSSQTDSDYEDDEEFKVLYCFKSLQCNYYTHTISYHNCKSGNFRSQWWLRKLILRKLVRTINANAVRGRSYKAFFT